MKVAKSFVVLSFVAGLVLATSGSGFAQRSPGASRDVVRAAVPLVRVGNSTLGKVLITRNGLTLYHRLTDFGGVISCTGACLTAWPPLLLPAGMKKPTAGRGVTDKLGVIKRPDISPTARQVTYDGWPLYNWFKDTAAGQTTGEGIGHFVVVPPAPRVTFTVAITTTSGETWGVVKLHYVYRGKSFNSTCKTASCTFAKVHADVKVKLTQAPTSPGNWSFQNWDATPVDGGASKTPTASSITIKSDDSYTVDATYVAGGYYP